MGLFKAMNTVLEEVIKWAFTISLPAPTKQTVVAEYAAEYNVRPEKYQSEAELEREFIRQLTSQGYEYISVHNEAALIENLRKQLELLNDLHLLIANGIGFSQNV